MDDLLQDLDERARDTHQRCCAPEGMYRVMGIDRFEGTDWVHGDYPTEVQALGVARSMTDEGKQYASDRSVATVFYAYDEHGTYLGGDTWTDE